MEESPLPKESPPFDPKHMHRQLKAVRELTLPQYRPAFHKMIKVLELWQIMDELSQVREPVFRASSVAAAQTAPAPCSLSDFIEAIDSSCTPQERSFLYQLKQIQKNSRIIQQFLKLQENGAETRPESAFLSFLTPEQLKTFHRFDSAFHHK